MELCTTLKNVRGSALDKRKSTGILPLLCSPPRREGHFTQTVLQSPRVTPTVHRYTTYSLACSTMGRALSILRLPVYSWWHRPAFLGQTRQARCPALRYLFPPESLACPARNAEGEWVCTTQHKQWHRLWSSASNPGQSFVPTHLSTNSSLLKARTKSKGVWSPNEKKLTHIGYCQSRIRCVCGRASRILLAAPPAVTDPRTGVRVRP